MAFLSGTPLVVIARLSGKRSRNHPQPDSDALDLLLLVTGAAFDMAPLSLAVGSPRCAGCSFFSHTACRSVPAGGLTSCRLLPQRRTHSDAASGLEDDPRAPANGRGSRPRR